MVSSKQQPSDDVPAKLTVAAASATKRVTAAVKTAPAKVKVLVVDRNVPTLPAGAATAVALTDSQQALLATYGAGPDRNASPAGQVTAILVDKSGNVIRTFSHANGIGDFRDALTALS